MTPDAARRLLADLPASEPPHPIDAGLLGEYAFVERTLGPATVAETYPQVAAHLRAGCERCRDDLEALATLARRTGQAARRGQSRPGTGNAPSDPARPARPPAPAVEEQPVPEVVEIPEPLEIAEAVALARSIDVTHDTLRAPLQPDRAGQVDTRRQSARRRHLLLVEAALTRQQLLARRLFLQRARSLLDTPGVRGLRQPNPKARLLLDDFANSVDDLARLAGRIGRLTTDLRRLGDDPRGPARSQSEALTERGLALTREALVVARRLARLQGPLAGMVT